jgi:hypothetical protein
VDVEGRPVGYGREITFTNLFNVRDLGGHPTADGRVISHGRWFRGASMHRIAGEDVAVLQGLGVRTALDLRTAQEIVDHGAFPAAATGVRVRHLPLIPRTWDRRDDLDTPAAATAYLVERFVDMLETGGSAIATAVEILADPEHGPVIAYCMAGKDRTGVLTATVMALLGVPDEEIARDFHRSHEAAERLFAWAEDEGDDGASGNAMVHQVPYVAAAPPEAIIGFLAEARRRHGTIENYAAKHGVGEGTLAALRAQLLTDSGQDEQR